MFKFRAPQFSCTSTRVFNLTASHSFTPPFCSETRDQVSFPPQQQRRRQQQHTGTQTEREVVCSWRLCCLSFSLQLCFTFSNLRHLHRVSANYQNGDMPLRKELRASVAHVLMSQQHRLHFVLTVRERCPINGEVLSGLSPSNVL